MNKFKKIFAVILVIICIATCTILAGCSFLTNKTSTLSCDKYDDADKYSVGNFEYSKDITKIEVKWIVGEVKVVTSTEDNLKVSEKGADKLADKEKLHYYIDGNVLKIKFWEAGLKQDFKNTDYKNLTIEVPEGVSLEIKSVTAKVSASGLKLANLEIETISASVELEEVTVLGELEVESLSGALNLTKIECDDIEIGTTSSAVGLSLVSGKKVEIKSATGAVTLKLLNELGATIDFNSISGSLSSSNGTLIGDGAVKVKVDTMSGSLTVK